jgi:hypothetical protein
VSDPTQPLPTTETCPRGHVLTAEQIVVRDGMKVCPTCEQEATSWASPTPPRPRNWSRRLLRIPLAIVAGGLFALAISSAFDIAANAAFLSHDLPGSTSELVGAIFSTIAELALAGAVGWIAWAVGLEDQPGH